MHCKHGNKNDCRACKDESAALVSKRKERRTKATDLTEKNPPFYSYYFEETENFCRLIKSRCQCRIFFTRNGKVIHTVTKISKFKKYLRKLIKKGFYANV